MSADQKLVTGAAMRRHEQRIEQLDLIRYAGASGDFNRLHWDSGYAATASPTSGVIVHGMLNIAVLLRVVGDWVGGDDRIVSTSVSLRAPCPVGALVSFGGHVVEVDEQARTAVLAVSAELPDGAPVVDGKRSRVTVRLG
ncbi:dehydratase [Plantactinospora sp. S1510]|uniref:Dehydratase n=1 Tax=Plantactinospora alkalitolerans TaxID=2789879 RepID=A0ABS0GRN8_9ACTN|nr:MaoC/PaaZ C-terminal domain-containing protein [Plantactinospora alkalitolerans]MBF9128835.1 dehydratase [Plantactinospora alkalitolerans]